MKRKSKGYVPKKSKVLEAEHVFTFIKEAPDNDYLMHKVVLLMGIFGGLRRDELVKMTVDDVQDKGSCVLIKVPETKTGESKGFTIVEETKINALNLVRKYFALRLKNTKERRFFLTYRNGRCTVQPVGKNTIGNVPTIIAKFLKLADAGQYTGHCLRRTSATLLAEAGASFETLKMHGKWKSDSVAEGYIEESVCSKNKVSAMIVDTFEATIDKFEATSADTIIETSENGSENQVFTNNKENSRPQIFSGNFNNCTFNFYKT